MQLIPLLVCLSTLLDCTFAQNCAKCNMNAKCEIRNGVEGCYCSTGFTGNGIAICKDDNECENATQPCGENANCTNTLGSYYCMCAPGFRSSSNQDRFVTNDGTACVDIDECSEAVTVACGDHAKCENVVGGYNCSCKEGYQPNTGKLWFKPNDGTYCQENMKEKCHLDDACIAANVNKTLSEIRHIKEPVTLLQEIYRGSAEELSPVDIITYVEVLALSSPLLSVMNNTISDKELVTNTTINVFINVTNSLVQKDKISIWSKLSTGNRRTILTKLMHTVEQATLSLSQNFKKATQIEVNSSDMALKVFAFDSHHMKHIHPHVSMEGDYIKIYSRKKDGYDSNGTVAVVFLRYDSIGSLLSSSESSLLEIQNSDSSEQQETVISSVIAVTMSSSPPTFYQLEKITFTLNHLRTADKDSSKCAFWNYSPDTMNGNWSTEGCEVTHSNSTHTSCKCNHLTHFAILMSSGSSLGITNYNILTRITQLGIIISLICLAICIFTFWFFSEIQSTRTTIHKNLCCSLFLAELVFLVGINTNSNKLFCSVIAGLLHYFFLAAFAWMCIEGIHLYLIVVGVIYNKGFLHKNFYIFGYLSPAVVVGISAALGYRYYGTTKVCWLSTENNFIWSFIGPACLIILVNLLAFGVIIYKVFRHTSMLKPEVSCYENIRSCARGALALLFLLGATWIFGVLHVVQGSVVTAYLFTICNAFQGMFIFLFLCVLSRKIQEEYYRLFKNVPCCFGCLR
ncbi:adhesion G protein-coupled receptor L4 [Tachyglossus aculeatus]|uniref:adhesion G protein-coupled receptor L4 n=1 Tax=Tachyglossus aculeatus TaxID=9261 RepID=UPI0018F6B0AF|nr:adhesion G protein-coupled receptor L4 [Tachyglossus aculeatus]